MSNRIFTQVVVVNAPRHDPNKISQYHAMFNEDGTPFVGGGSGGAGPSLHQFEFSWDTPGIDAGVNTGIVVPEGTRLGYNTDWIDLTEGITATPPGGSWQIVLGSGPNMVNSESPDVAGPDQLAGYGSNDPYPVDVAQYNPNNNPKMVKYGLSPYIGDDYLALEDVELWIAFFPLDGQVINSGAGIYNILF